MNNILKKIVAIATALTVTVWLVGPGIAQAITIEELEAQIADLLATLTTLQAELATLKGEVTVEGCTITSFDRALSQGMSGDDVNCLQIVLNTATDTQLADSGVGSPGEETSYFGPLTKAAVIKFQEKYADEVLASWGLTTGTGYVGTTTRAKLNELLTGPVVPTGCDCTAWVDDVCGGGDCLTTQMNQTRTCEPEEGAAADVCDDVTTSQCVADTTCDVVAEEGLTVALDADTPAAAVVPGGASNLEYLKLTFTAGEEDATLDGLTITRGSVGAAADFSNVYLYEGSERLTSGRTVSSQTQEASFPNLNLTITVGTPRTFTVVATMAKVDDGATAGDVNHFSVALASDVDTTATVNGTFPITGNAMTLSAQDVGGLTIATSGTPADPYVGDKQAEVSRFKLTAGSEEDVELRRIIFTNGGSISSSDITNLKLYRGTELLAETDSVGTGDRVSFALDTSYTLLKGENRVFKVLADISGRPDETIDLYIDYDTDIYALGKTFGGGVEITNTFTASDVSDLTLQGGMVTISTSGPTAAKVAADGNDVSFLNFSMIASQDVEVRSTKVYICWDDGGTGTYNDITTTSGAGGGDILSEINDVKIKNLAGGVVAGPTDGSGFAKETTSSNVCGTGVMGAQKTWSDYYDLNEGETLDLSIALDLDQSTELSADDKIKVVLDEFGDNEIKSRVTNDYVAGADIVPSSDISGAAMTIASTSLTITLASTPVSDTYITGTTGVGAVGFLMKAGEASDITVTGIDLSAYVDDDETGTGATDFTIGVRNSIYANNIASAVYLYDSAGLVAGPKSITSAGKINFSNLNWEVAAGETKKLTVKADISTVAPTGTYDRIKFDIAAASDVSCEDKDGKSVDAINDAQNGGRSGATTYTIIKVAATGTLTYALAADTALSDIVIAGNTGVEIAKFKFATTDEAFQVTKLELKNASSNYDDAIETLYITYPTDTTGTTETKSGNFSSGVADFAGLNFYVPKDEAAYLTIKADLNTIAVGADSGDKPRITFDWDTEFEAVGVGSGNTLTTVASADVDAKEMVIRKAKPILGLASSQASSLMSTTDLIKFTVEAEGNEIALKKLKFDIVIDEASTTTAMVVGGSAGWELYNLTDDPGRTNDLAADAAAFGDGSGNSDPSFDDSTRTLYVELDSELEVAKGAEKILVIQASISNISGVTTEIDKVSTRLAAEEDSNVRTGAITTDTNNLVQVASTDTSYVWSDISAGVATHDDTLGSSSNDWTNGYKVKTLPSEYVEIRS